MSLVIKGFRQPAVAIAEVGVSRGIALSACQQSEESQQPDVAQRQTVLGRRARQSLDDRLGLRDTIVGCAIEQGLDQNTRRRNAPRQQLALADQIIDGPPHERYGAIEISAPCS